MNLKKVVAAAAAAVLLICGLYFGGLFVAHGFNPDFLSIDSCLDRGGQWDDASRSCEGVP